MPVSREDTASRRPAAAPVDLPQADVRSWSDPGGCERGQQRCARPSNVGLDLGERGVQAHRNFLIREVFEMIEHEGYTLMFRQTLQCAVDQGSTLLRA